MNIQIENSDQATQLIRIEVEPADYNEKLESGLKEFRRTARIPGFRPGMVPAGMIKKLYGKAIKAEEISRLVSSELNKYISEQQINIIGEPLPVKNESEFDWDNQLIFEFSFEIGLRPEIDLGKLSDMEMPYYQITITDELLDSHVQKILKDFGEMSYPNKVVESSEIHLQASELDEEENEMPGELNNVSVYIVYQNLDNEIQKVFLDKEKNTSVVLPLNKVLATDKEIENSFRNIATPEAIRDKKFRFNISEIMLWSEASYGETLYKKLFPENTPETETEFRDRIRQDLREQLYKNDRDMLFFVQAREKAISQLNPLIPTSFMKRWMLAIDSKLSPETLEKSWQYYEHELQWELIEGKIEHDNNISVSEQELKEYVAGVLMQKYFQFGYNLNYDQISAIVDRQIEKKEERKKFEDELLDKKLTAYFKSVVMLNNEEITESEFFQKIGYNPDATKEASEHDHSDEHDHEHDDEHDHEHSH